MGALIKCHAEIMFIQKKKKNKEPLAHREKKQKKRKVERNEGIEENQKLVYLVIEQDEKRGEEVWMCMLTSIRLYMKVNGKMKSLATTYVASSDDNGNRKIEQIMIS